jgi:hypothetical protein
MNLLISARTLGHGLVLSSSLFLLQGNHVLAAEAVGDAQMQARDLLSGTAGGRTNRAGESRVIPSGSDQTSSLDPQEQARQLILGKPNLGETHGRAVDHLTNDDPQESARRMILGDAARGTAAPALKHSVSLTQEPLVMRLNKDEFRVAFGLDAGRFASNGGNGVISYRVDWKTEDGTARSDIKRVKYTVSPGASRTIAVDQQYFDTAEGAHTTDVVKVSVEKITYLESPPVQTESTMARAAPEHAASPVRSF